MQATRISLFAMMLAAAGLPLYIHLPRFATAELGVSLATLAAVLAGIRVLDFVQDPLLGWITDRWPQERATFAALAAFGMAMGFLLLYTYRPAAGGVLPWLVIALVLLFTAYSLGTVLFYGQSTALAGSPEALIRLAGFREGGTLAGIILAALAPSLLGALGASQAGYPAFGGLLAGLCIAVWWLTRGLWTATPRPEQPLSIPALREAGGFRLLALALVNSLPVAMTSTLFLFFVEDKLALADMAGPFLVLFFLAAGFSVPLWTRATDRFGARNVLFPAMILAILSFVSAAFLPAGAALGFAMICVGSGAALGADMVILPVLFSRMLARAGLQAGQAFGLWSFTAKLALAAAAVLLLPMLQLSGFTPGGQNSIAALQTLTWAYAIIPCCIKLIAIAMVLRLPRKVTAP
ncbi:putative MFS-type transporter [Phaeobacter inhibens]|uniref:MFS-type transporter n=1 Tax=Phaeobacter inhibens TaxID=221822 RepID=A0ABM6RAK8_9RHOB|nr:MULTISPECIES: MFS transporter [Phaeobacter]AUQ48881.1 putative MFS-type transporter [Phaeobacter inhibens]AUQ93381.1 putative MFS-type transporter [Phaeobacter inhibens]AUR18684.1 putative MFS-type transporter [Phaeobacter inhibens]MBQ4809118.1 MFS transporter [Phaeobacter sp. HS012]MBQ4883905.1 MFS transporter [Phaeobacter sp. HS011]